MPRTMRAVTLIGVLLISTGATAQSWCPPGAVWVYRFENGMNVDFRIEYRYLYDTVITGLTAYVIQGHSFGTFGGPPIDQT